MDAIKCLLKVDVVDMQGLLPVVTLLYVLNKKNSPGTSYSNQNIN